MTTFNDVLDISTSSEAPRLPTTKELRDKFRSALDKSTSAQNRHSSTIKIHNLGETKDAIINAVTAIASFQEKDSVTVRLLNRFGMSKMSEKLRTNVREVIIEGKTVRQVATEMVSSLEMRRDGAESASTTLIMIGVDMEKSYRSMDDLVNEAQAAHDAAPPHEKIRYSSIVTEIRETMNYVAENIQSAAGTVRAAELLVSQMSGLIPRLRAIMTDAMEIRSVLADLGDLGKVADMLDETMQIIRDDNHQKMEATLMAILERSVISDKQMKHIETSGARSLEMQTRLENKLLEINVTQQQQAERLKSSTLRIGNSSNGMLHLERSNKEQW